MKSIHLFLTLCLLWLHGLVLPAENIHSYKFEKVHFSGALPQATVRSIIQNRQGFMWFATTGGLVKYDGYRTRTYSFEPGNSKSLSSSDIKVIYEDRDGFLWIGTVGGGMNRFDPVAETVVHFSNRPDSEYKFMSNYIFDICGDDKGDLWIGTYLAGFSRLRWHQDQYGRLKPEFTNYVHDHGNPHSISSDIVLALYPDRFGHIWVGTENGLNRFNPKRNIFDRFYSNIDNIRSISSNRISDVFEDSSGTLWIGTLDQGLNRLDNIESTKKEVTFTRYRMDPDDPFSLSDDTIGCIFEDSLHTIWIGTVGGGLNRFDRETEKFISFKYGSFNKRSLSGNQVHSMCEDKTGNLWIGMGKEGVNKLNLNSRYFVNFDLDYSDKKEWANSFFALFYDQDNNLLAGNEYGFLIKFNLEPSEQTKALIGKPRTIESLKISNRSIRSIHRDKYGCFWIGTRGDGIHKIYTKGFRIIDHIIYRYNPADPSSLGSDAIYDILEDKLGNLWIGTGERGISLLTPENKEKGKFIHKRRVENDPHSLSHNYVRTIYEDSKDIIWVGTHSGGLNRFDRKKNRFLRYTYNPDNPSSLSSNSIWAILEDMSGVLWIGTADAGLNKFDSVSGLFTRYSREDGLPDNTIYGILEDDQKNLWISTNKGLSKFDPRSESFVNFSEKDGIQDDEFNFGSCLKNVRTGQLYFGGIHGITTFFPETIVKNTFAPPVQITSFSVHNKKISNTRLSNNSQVVLSYRDYMFSFEFVSLDFTNPLRNRYAYKLRGFNDDWIETDWSRRIATFTNIPPGRYTFIVKGSNNHGVWNEQGVSINIVILPPFWQTWWFRMIVIVLLALAIFLLHKRRMQNLKIRLKTENEINRIYAKTNMTAREIEIIDLIKKKKSYKEIEDELFISYHTVKNHIHNIFKKLGVANRAELIYYLKSIRDEIRRDKK